MPTLKFLRVEMRLITSRQGTVCNERQDGANYRVKRFTSTFVKLRADPKGTPERVRREVVRGHQGSGTEQQQLLAEHVATHSLKIYTTPEGGLG